MVTRRIETRSNEALQLVARVMDTHAALMQDRCPPRVVLTVEFPDAGCEDALVSMIEGTLRMAPKRYVVTVEPRRKWTSPAAPLDIQPVQESVPVKSLDPVEQRIILDAMIREVPLDKAQATVMLNTLIGRMIESAVAERAK